MNSTRPWELDDPAAINDARLIAKEKIANADAVIIIGYSFPDFNRIVDQTFFRRKFEDFIRARSERIRDNTEIERCKTRFKRKNGSSNSNIKLYDPL